ncbi:MAG: phosphoesterase PA-phosphatase related protein [Chitinophagaceae bacterium]|nr:phosphoesterase PA-phosphatase related protein [Chitinophagaceae bacterium]
MIYRNSFLTIPALILFSSVLEAQATADSMSPAFKSTIINKAKQPVFCRYFDTTAKQLSVHYNTWDLFFTKPCTVGFMRYLPEDMWQIAKAPFQKKNLAWLSVTAAGTLILIPFDQRITDAVKKVSSRVCLHPDTKYGILLKMGQTKIVKYPRNINSGLYQLGEGGTSMLLAGGLWIYGKATSDYRALQSASDLAETFIIMGVTTQLLKRSFGRQSPFMATTAGGHWHPFPSFKNYQENTSDYDAFPSGHLATMMATVTVLSTNYPEKQWIKPIGYALMVLTGWAMINTDVHWIADYPLSLALGYLSGKISAMRHEKKKIRKAITL